VSDIALSPSSKSLTFEPIQRVYTVCGEDADLIADAVQAIRSAAISDDCGDFDWEEFDAGSANVEDILASAYRAPVVSQRRLVVVHQAELFGKADRKAAADRLAEGIHSLPGLSCLVLVAKSDGASGKPRSAAINAALDRAVRSVGAIVRCSALDVPGLIEWASLFVRDCGKELTRKGAQRLVASGDDRTAIRHALEKLVAYVGERSIINEADVDAVVGQAPEDVMFRLVDAVSGRRASDALLLLRRAAAFETRAQALASKLVALLTRQMRLLWQARELNAEGIALGRLRDTAAQLAGDLPQDGSIASVAWKAPALGRDAARWTRDELVQALELLIECDAGNKGEEIGASDTMANLELLVVRLCGSG
jgi:DNA polymerase-3 subunit delta